MVSSPLVRFLFASLSSGSLAAQSLTVATISGSTTNLGIDDGPLASATWYDPTDVAAGVDGSIWVTDASFQVVRRVSAEGQVTTVAGTPFTRGSQDGLGSAASFDSPEAVAVRGDGVAVLADTNNHVLRRVAPDGTVTTWVGAAGQPGFADGTAGAARFRFPRGLAFDDTGALWVADSGNDAIRRVSASGEVTTFVGAPGFNEFVDGPASEARLDGPRDVIVLSSGDLVIADGNNSAVRRITPQGVVTTLATGLLQPASLVQLPSGEILVADTYHRTIERVDGNGTTSPVAGTRGGFGVVDGTGPAVQFSSPNGLAVSATRGLLIADRFSYVLRAAALEASGGMFTSVVSAEGRVGTAFNLVLTTSAPATGFSATGLPPGLIIDAASGGIGGTPTRAGIFVVELAAQASGGPIRGQLTITVARGPASITLGSLPTRYLAEGPAVATATTNPPGLAVTITYDGRAEPPTRPGDVFVEARVADPDREPVSASGSWRLRGTQAITWSLPEQVTLAAGPFSLGAEATSGLPLTAQVVSGPATLSGGVLTPTGTGTVVVRASQAGSSIWDPAPASERLVTVVSGVAADPLVAGGDGLSPVLREALVVDAGGWAGDALPVVGVEAGRLVLRYTRRLDAPWLSYVVEAVSSPRPDATVLAVLQEEATEALDEQRERVTVRDVADPGPSPTRFLRLRVTNTGTVVRVAGPTAPVPLGAVVTLRAQISGAPVSGYVWRKDGEVLSGQTRSTLTLTAGPFDTAGRYSVETSGPGGFSMSPAFRLEVIEAPEGIFLTGGQFFTTTPEGTEIAGLRAFGRDGSEVTSFRLVAGEGDEDNGDFRIVGRKVRTAIPFAGASRQSWNIRVRAEDRLGGVQEQALQLRLVGATGVAADFRVIVDNTFSPPFPVVEAWLDLNEDLEAVDVVWWGEREAEYAIEVTTDGSTWRLLSDARHIENTGPAQVMRHIDYGADWQGRIRWYRVRRVDLPTSLTRLVELPSTLAVASVPQLGFALEGRTIVAPVGEHDGSGNIAAGASRLEWVQDLVDPTGRASYYEIVVGTSIGTQVRTTRTDIRLPLSSNFTLGQDVRLSVFAYAWNGELVAARVDEPLRAWFDDLMIDGLSNLRIDANPRIGLAYIRGASHRGTLRVNYGRVDRRTGSTILDLVLDRADGSEPNFGSFRLLLPQGLADGEWRWSSVDSANASSPLITSMEAPAVDYDFPFFVGGDWRRGTGGFRWDTFGPNRLNPFGDTRSYGFFDIQLVTQDAAWEVWRIDLVNDSGWDAVGVGTITVVIPRRY